MGTSTREKNHWFGEMIFRSATSVILPCLRSSVVPVARVSFVRHLSQLDSQYRSKLSLDNVYSRENKTSSTPPVSKANEFSGFIPINELKITYSCSSGPGGQNVNKVSTKVDLRFHLESATWLSEEVKGVLKDKFQRELTKDGWLIVKSDRTRSQLLNQADALEKLRANIRQALIPPKPALSVEEKEKMRKGKLKASRERLHTKRVRSDVKEGRGGPDL